MFKYFPLHFLQQHSFQDHYNGDKLTSSVHPLASTRIINHKNDGQNIGYDDSHVHTIDSEKNMGHWQGESLTFQNLPSMEPLQQANIILSSTVSKLVKSGF